MIDKKSALYRGKVLTRGVDESANNLMYESLYCYMEGKDRTMEDIAKLTTELAEAKEKIVEQEKELKHSVGVVSKIKSHEQFLELQKNGFKVHLDDEGNAFYEGGGSFDPKTTYIGVQDMMISYGVITEDQINILYTRFICPEHPSTLLLHQTNEEDYSNILMTIGKKVSVNIKKGKADLAKKEGKTTFQKTKILMSDKRKNAISVHNWMIGGVSALAEYLEIHPFNSWGLDFEWFEVLLRQGYIPYIRKEKVNEIYTCECGKSIKNIPSNIDRHKQTRAHKKWVQSQAVAEAKN